MLFMTNITHLRIKPLALASGYGSTAVTWSLVYGRYITWPLLYKCVAVLYFTSVRKQNSHLNPVGTSKVSRYGWVGLA